MDKHHQADDQRAEQLAKRGAERLAAFVLKLGQTVDGVEERIEAFLTSDNYPSAVQLAARWMAEVRRSRQFYHGCDGAQVLVARLDNILDVIETAVLPVNASAALDLIVQLMDCDGTVFESANDSDGIISEVFRRACELFADAAKGVPSGVSLPVLKRLVAEDGYGARAYLLQGVGRFLDRPHLETFIGELRAGLAGGGESAERARWQLKAVAESVQDPVLYEEAINSGRSHNLQPRLAIEVARHYLDAGRPREALERLPASVDELASYGFEYHDLRVQALRAVGDTEAIRSALWARFIQVPSPDTLGELLEAEAAGERVARREAALKEIRARLRPQSLAEFFAEIGEIDAAAGVVLGSPGQLNGDMYFGLVPLAEKLAPAYPLAASLVYRALLNSILLRGQSKHYRQGGRYWVLLLKIGARVTDWKGFETELEYRERTGREHPRKAAFWRAAREAMAES